MNPAILGLMIPLVAIVLGLAIPIIGLSLEYRMKRDLFELHHKETMAAIDKGVDIPPLPPGFFRSRKRKPSTPGTLLLIGLILALGGAGLIAAMSYAADTWSLWGLIPVGVGLAYLISFLYERTQPRVAEVRQADE